MALHYSARLPDLPTSLSLPYLAAMAGFWGVLYLVCTVGLSFFLPRARWLTLAAVPLHQAHVWTNRLVFDRSDYARQTYPRDLLLTLILLVFFWAVLNLPRMREAFVRAQGEDQPR